MAANDLSFNQLATVLNAIYTQAAGTPSETPIDESSFVTVAQRALLTGYDPLMTAVSQVLSKTIFSVRPYNALFEGLQRDSVRFGNHVRKLSPIDKPFEEDDRLKLVDGEAINQQVVNKPAVFQGNFYGANQYQKSITIYRDQLDSAFTSSEQFGSFLSMVTQNISDQLEHAREVLRRQTLVNLMAGVATGGSAAQVVHLKTRYAVDILGMDETDDAADIAALNVFDPQYFGDFAKFMFAQIVTISQSMRERSYIYHINPTEELVEDDGSVTGYIMRHTPVQRQQLYLLSPMFNYVDAAVLSGAFHDEYLRLMPHEFTTFWQDITAPTKIDVTCTYMLPSGALDSDDFASTAVLGVLMDEEAAGVTQVNQWTANAPFNARGGYINTFWHETTRYYNDFTENAVVFMLD